MGDNSDKALLLSSKIVRKIMPKARSLRVHGIFTKTTTQIGMVATKATFILVRFLQKEVPIPLVIDRLISINDSELKMIARQKRFEDLKKKVKRSHEVLFSATTVFPMTLFPDSVTIDRTKATIHRRNFFFVSDVMSIRIEDILNVSCGVGPLFGSITITSRIMSSEDRFTINFFWRQDAVRLKHVLQGYVIALQNNFECDHLGRQELLEMLSELGHDSNS
jgi:hypothetical protein